MNNSYINGKNAENTAVAYLKQQHWNVVMTNYKAKWQDTVDNRFHYGEIDIIAELPTVTTPILAAFEVKTRKNLNFLAYSISDRQKLRIQNAFLHFLAKNPQYNDYTLRFDAMLIGKSIQHIENAWEAVE